MFKMKECHIDLITYIYHNSVELKNFVVKMVGIHIKLTKVLGLFYDSPKEVVFPFLRAFVGEKFLYHEPDMIYSLMRLL